MVTIRPIVSSRNTGTVILRAPTLHQTTIQVKIGHRTQKSQPARRFPGTFSTPPPILANSSKWKRDVSVFSRFLPLILSFAILPKILCAYAAMTTVFLTNLSGTFFFKMHIFQKDCKRTLFNQIHFSHSRTTHACTHAQFNSCVWIVTQMSARVTFQL